MSKRDNIRAQLEREGIFLKSQEEYRVSVEANWRFFAFFRALHVSPSYWAVHKMEITGSAKGLDLPSDWETVRRTYDRFGSVWDIPFWTWWFERAQFQFGIQHMPVPRVLGVTPENTQLNKQETGELALAVERHYNKGMATEGLPATLLLSVPIRNDRKALLAEIEKLLDQHQVGAGFAPPFKMLKNNVRRQTVRMALRAVQARAYMPEQPLYVIGKRIGVGTYDLDESVKYGYDDSRRELSMLTSRYLRRAYLLGENAARGQFPSFTPPPAESRWPKLDFDELGERLATYARVSDEALEQIPAVSRNDEPRYAGRNRTVARLLDE